MDEQEAVVCFGCVGDQHLQTLIKREGASAKCSYCKKRRKAITVERLSDLVADVMYAFFEDTSIWERGDELNFHVADILGRDDTDDLLVGDVCGELVNCSHWDIMQGGESRFNEFGLYMPRQLRPKEAERKWQDFRASIMHKSRFFNQSGKEFLEWLFGNIDSYRSFRTSDLKHDSVVRVITVDDCIELFRARQCDSQKDLLDILTTPAKHLAAPPKELASAGRMNPAGVPVFYGAFDRATCIAELRPPVGGSVISGQFLLTRDVRVLDFKRLEDAYEHAPLSMFDPDYRLKHERRKFLLTFHDKISSPVLPKQEHEYLTTQVIAEYLSTQHSPRIDGVIFSSAQRKGGLNIVLFAHVVSGELTSSVISASADQSVQDIGIEYIPESLVLHKIDAVEFSPKDLKVDDGEPDWSTGDPEFDDDWDW
ncbi:RES domain-containing protein [Pseudomonas mandelii]|uniref:RES domain-containing protein n=1 Tax=Pseudomonas mandelii TaxID=75612 RepID=A0ABY0VVI7_9PSED|nr:RES domain-containing protein [Pseudomonas mandelii]TWS07960.1 RES domain-containing protein [Pseudomonas mandelii]SDU58460.1 RES domain-containing protein [Pseudomonas mandelii]